MNNNGWWEKVIVANIPRSQAQHTAQATGNATYKAPSGTPSSSGAFDDLYQLGVALSTHEPLRPSLVH